jgi:hypothetical protein
VTILAYRKFRYIYVAGPYSNGDTGANVREAILAAEKLVKAEYTPYIPHLSHFWHIIAPHDYEFWLDYDLNWLAKCDAVLRLPGVSSGADREMEYAKNIGIPVFYSIEEIR